MLIVISLVRFFFLYNKRKDSNIAQQRGEIPHGSNEFIGHVVNAIIGEKNTAIYLFATVG